MSDIDDGATHVATRILGRILVAELLSVASADSRSRLWSGEILRLKREIAQDVRDLIALRAAARATARGRKRRGDGTWEPGDPRNPTLRHPTRPI